MPHRLIEPEPQSGDLFVQLDDALPEFVGRETVANAAGYACPHVFGFPRVQGSRPLRAVAINCDRLQPEPPAFDVRVHDLVDGGCLRHVNRFGNRAAQERLRRCHHTQMRHVA